MNYEELYKTLQTLEKNLKDSLSAAQKLEKTIEKNSESGDLKTLSKNISALADYNAAQAQTLSDLNELVNGFDSKAYFESGDFAGQMLAYCQEKGIDVKGEYPVYEMFPYRVKFDAENQDIYLDRKRLQCMRPQSFVNTVKAGQDKLNKASFNAQTFATELAEAYDLALLKSQKPEGSDVYLTTLYKLMTPMGRSRKDYDIQSFAFDIARLRSQESLTTKDGRRHQFGPSRHINKAIRILRHDGKEEYLATIRFFR